MLSEFGNNRLFPLTLNKIKFVKFPLLCTRVQGFSKVAFSRPPLGNRGSTELSFQRTITLILRINLGIA